MTTTYGDMPEILIKLSISSYDRIPIWIKMILAERGFVPECISDALLFGYEEYKKCMSAIEICKKCSVAIKPIEDKINNLVYNAAQRGIYNFLKNCGFRKRRYGKKVCWSNCEIITGELYGGKNGNVKE